MTELITAIVPYISPAALPTVVVVLGLFYIYRKIGNERKDTKIERDKDSENIKAEIAVLKNELEQIKALDLSTKLAQISTDINWIKLKLMEKK